MKRYKDTGRLKYTKFPPKPLSEREKRLIISKHCKRVSPTNFVEHGCAVCGRLTPRKETSPLSLFKGDLDLLMCNNIVPKFALARHNWVGNILIARVRHNRCVVRVNSGRVRMSANAIMFSQPILKVYHRLPPSREELNEVLAFVFTGYAHPTPEEFERTPMLVRRQNVLEALEWLKLNHEGYWDLEISMDNLMSYPDRGIPVVVDYRRSKGDTTDSVPVGSTAVNEIPKERGTKSGKCTFAVHGLTSEEYATASMETIKHVALQHLTRGGTNAGYV
ncbi:hypothetical protein B0H14DRAFT_3089223 [Mycena olivaceomarginata]|nr:hypothetical protein B0H14DRAFT_3089223 [Mycena olivaceomarginata]